MAEIVWTNEAVQCLERHPRLGQRYERIVDRGVREILYGHDRIAYLVQDDEKVEILGVFHSAIDIDRLIH